MQKVEATDWEYSVQIKRSVRLYWNPETKDNEERYGFEWSLTRSTPTEEGQTFFQSIVVSPEVFESVEEAKQNALDRLSMLRCPIDRPLDMSIKFILDGR